MFEILCNGRPSWSRPRAAPSRAAKEEAPTYHVDRLTSESFDFLGVAPHVAAGAFAGQRKQNFTTAEAQGLVDKWLKTPVDVDPATAEGAQ